MEASSWIRSPRGAIAVQGAHVTSWRGPLGEGLFLSSRSRFEPGVAIRGGVPVIFPWFGDDPEGRGRGAHGFARRLSWRVVRSEDGGEGLRAELELVDDESTRALWPMRFALRLAVTLGNTLELALSIVNRDPEPFACEVALHTYLGVEDVRAVRLRGLEGATYLDKPSGLAPRVQGSEPLVFAGEVDRVYAGNTATCRVEDPLLGRALEVEKQGARSTIVWNPWSEKAARLADLGAEWPRFVCVESGNVGPDALSLASGASATVRVRLAAHRL